MNIAALSTVIRERQAGSLIVTFETKAGVHCGDRQHLTTMYPAIKNWVHFECSPQWVYSVSTG